MTNTKTHLSRKSAIAVIYIAYGEALNWKGTIREYGTDADLIATVQGGERTPAFKALVKDVRSGKFTQARMESALDAKVAWLNAR